jgi:hypothetical protein
MGGGAAPTDKAVAQSGEPRVGERLAGSVVRETIAWVEGPNLFRATKLKPHRRRKGEPLYRPLRVYTLDPTQPKLEGAVAVLKVPYEPLKKGPLGALFEVEGCGPILGDRESVDLDDPHLLLSNGATPSPSDARFHQQMVYGVASSVYNAFKIALGRDLSFGFERESEETPERIRLIPCDREDENAYYSPSDGTVRFGYFRNNPTKVMGRNIPNGITFTSMSHDVISHEVSHALLDGLRPSLIIPTNPDVFAFHEAFSDIVAIFRHFSYEEVVDAAMRSSKGKLQQATFLSSLAQQFAQSSGRGAALRTAVDIDKKTRYGEVTEPHELGAVLLAAVFDAYTRIFQRKTEVLLRLATNGTGVLPPGELPRDLRDQLARKASRLANQFLVICIRAIDYLPPVDVTFGEFLRAVITADTDLVPDDPWAYREAWLDAFRDRGIYPTSVDFLTEDAVLWSPPGRQLDEIPELSFAKLQFRGDPGTAMDREEIKRQAKWLANTVCSREYHALFGLAESGDPALDGDVVDAPVLQSIRTSRRIGPDGQILFDLVAEITQVRHVRTGNGEQLPFYGGVTVITGPNGEIRYSIVKRVASANRLAAQKDFITGAGSRFWAGRDGSYVPKGQPFQLLHNETEHHGTTQ